MSDFPQRQPDRSIKARPADTFSPELLARVIRGLCGPGELARVIGPARCEVPRTADELPRVPGYPKPDPMDPHASRYAATMRRVSAATGTTGLGDYWQQPGVFTVAGDGSGCFWQGPGFTTTGGAA